jgi:ATP-dependent phosphofructokinase / diphosphate-dependent phosphofructokinase
VSSPPLRRIAICTGGGDAPGLNAVIRAVVLAAVGRGIEVFGIREGYSGILTPESFPEGGVVPLTVETVRGITHRGGTILGTTNRGDPLRFPLIKPDGQVVEVDRTEDLVRALQAQGFDALISVGGDGSMAIAKVLADRGVRVIGVPKTIDNDLDETVVTFGFDTAVAFATDCLDRLHSTAESHGRVMVVEVMGRYAGWIALHAGVAATADVILIPEIPYLMEKVAEKIADRFRRRRNFAIVVVAEGARPTGGGYSVLAGEPGAKERLAGAGDRVARELDARCGHETRLVVLGHLLRGGTPTAADRLIALRFGAAAVRALVEGHSGVMVALDPPVVRCVPLANAVQRMKRVQLDCDTIMTARELGICFGD